MDKKETRQAKDMKNQNNEKNILRNSSATKNKKDKDLPWWVELLFVQIGLPDRFLIKILKLKKHSKEFIKNEKQYIFIFLFVLASLAYLYPIVKYSKNKLYCESIAKNYIIENKKIRNLNKKQLRMLSTNFCNGGVEIQEIENAKG